MREIEEQIVRDDVFEVAGIAEPQTAESYQQGDDNRHSDCNWQRETNFLD
jgi:hypothetical protein